MRLKMKMVTAGAPGNPPFFTVFRSFTVSLGDKRKTHLENLIEKRCKSGTLEVNEALGLFHSMFHTRPMPSIRAFDRLIVALARKNHYSTVVSMFRRLMVMMDCVVDENFRPEMITMNVIINCFCHLKIVDLGFSVLAISLKYGLQSNAYTFGALLYGLCKQGSMHRAMDLYRDIVEKGQPCAETSYSVLIVALCKTSNKTSNTHKALEVLRRMQENGKIKPSVKCHNPIINSLCKERRVNEALTLFQDMINQGIVPDVSCYNCLIHGLYILGRVEESERFFIEMLERGISPDVYSCSFLIDSLCKEGKTQEAISLFELMTRRGIKPNVVTFNALISGLCKSSQLKKAAQFLNNMIDCGVLPDVVTYNATLDALCKEGRIAEVLNLLGAMTDAGLKPNVITYNTVANALCKERRTNEALGLLDLMIQSDIKLNVETYNSLINGLCNSNQREEATRLLKEMVSREIFPDTVTLNALLDVLSKKDMTKEAQKTFEFVLQLIKELDKTACST